jgi:molybdopterin biosynthesis enzyme
MKFGPVPVEEAVGQILGHNVSDATGRRALRKGRSLSAADVELLRDLGRKSVYVARPASDDVAEDAAADRIADRLAGTALHRTAARSGRVNFHAEGLGVFRVDVERLRTTNRATGVALATLRSGSVVRRDAIVATLKIVPFALPETVVAGLVAALEASGPVLGLDAIEPTRVGLILSGAPSARERILRSYLGALEPRLLALTASIAATDFVPLEDERDEVRLAATLERQIEQGVELVLLAGETAIQDHEDIAPRAIVRAGGEITAHGAPVDPGNLLLLAFKGKVAILGAPGCARSPKANIVDLVLPRLLAGERMDADALIELGHGGLLEDVPERPAPRGHRAAGGE